MGNLYYSNSFGDPNYLKFSFNLEKLIDNSGKKKPRKQQVQGQGVSVTADWTEMIRN